MHKITKLGKATFIFSPFSRIETAALGVFFGVGARYEKKNVKGIAHYLEHMVFKGSRKYSYRKIKREIEGRGGSLNAFTSQELTGYYAYFLNRNFEPTLDIIMDMVLNPLLEDNEIMKERNVILEEIKMYNDLPASRANMLLDQLIWQGHPLGEEVIGYRGTVERIGRQDLSRFQKEFYIPSNMVVCCAGDLDVDNVAALIQKKIGGNSAKASLKKTAPLGLEGIYINVESKKLAQAHLCLGFRSVSYSSEERFTAELINVILGANMSSRLFEEVREKKALCYDISTEARKYKDSGAFLIHLGLDRMKITVALNSILGELKKLKEKAVAVNELERAKDYLLGQMAMGLERPAGQMFFLAESYLVLGRISTFKNIKEKIEAVTPADIKKLAHRIFKFNNVCVSCIGDFGGGVNEKIRKAIISKDN